MTLEKIVRERGHQRYREESGANGVAQQTQGAAQCDRAPSGRFHGHPIIDDRHGMRQ